MLMLILIILIRIANDDSNIDVNDDNYASARTMSVLFWCYAGAIPVLYRCYFGAVPVLFWCCAGAVPEGNGAVPVLFWCYCQAIARLMPGNCRMPKFF